MGFIHSRLSGWTSEAVTDLHSTITLLGTVVVETQTEDDLSTGTLTLQAVPYGVRILNTDDTNEGTFTVNGLDLIVPASTGLETAVGGVPSATVEVTGSTSFIFHRLA